MYSADSRTRGLMHACSVSAKNKVLQLWIFPVRVRASCWVRASRPWVRSAIPQSTEYIRPTDSVERPTIHSVPSPSGRSGSTLNGGAAHHKSCAYFSPTNPLLLCTPMVRHTVKCFLKVKKWHIPRNHCQEFGASREGRQMMFMHTMRYAWAFPKVVILKLWALLQSLTTLLVFPT